MMIDPYYQRFNVTQEL